MLGVRCHYHSTAISSSACLNSKNVAAVLTAEDRIAAATYGLRLEISTARRIFLIHYNGLGDFPEIAPFAGKSEPSSIAWFPEPI